LFVSATILVNKVEYISKRPCDLRGESYTGFGIKVELSMRIR